MLSFLQITLMNLMRKIGKVCSAHKYKLLIFENTVTRHTTFTLQNYSLKQPLNSSIQANTDPKQKIPSL